uniref:eCIS core domain-containing protein n=1 Tax=uncultured organism TaxID=155900 RepID=D8VMS9_9ZZZZ|nr:conserved hypothetical protein [uncultured organism]
MSYTSKQAAQESQRVEGGANKVVSPKFTDQRASTSVQLKQQQLMNAVQRAGVEEDPMQGKFATVQRAEEEELLQGKFETAQLAEEEELLQGKFATAQLASLEEEPMQGKFEAAQLMEEEEPLQGKFEPAQLVELEDAEPVQGKFAAYTTVQREAKPNNTGLPNQLKAGIESLSGMSMDSVKVHYNSDKPTQLNAHAYAQGTDIHVAPGQEQHLPHEAWHVVQQAQGRVKPTTQMKGTSVNDDVGLETEADVMGAKAQQQGSSLALQDGASKDASYGQSNAPAQMKENVFITPGGKKHYADGWGVRVGVTDDDKLKAKIPEDAAGLQTFNLGGWFAPEVEQPGDIPRVKYAKDVYILSEDGRNDGETKVTHCGPGGDRRYYYRDTGTRCFKPWRLRGLPLRA